MTGHYGISYGMGGGTRSLGQILEKHCVCSSGHIFNPILMKLGQNVCLDDIVREYENESHWVKKLGH